MKPLLLDTNVLFALANERDELHEQAKLEISRLAEDQTSIIPLIVVMELVVSSYSDDFIRICRSFVNEFELSTEEDLVFMQLDISPEKRRSLKANDCQILAIAHRLDAKVLTFDKRLQKASAEVLD